MWKRIVVLVVVASLAGCATKRQALITFGIAGVGVAASGAYITEGAFDSQATCPDPATPCDYGALTVKHGRHFAAAIGGPILGIAGVAMIVVAIYFVVNRSEAWLDQPPGTPDVDPPPAPTP